MQLVTKEKEPGWKSLRDSFPALIELDEALIVGKATALKIRVDPSISTWIERIFSEKLRDGQKLFSVDPNPIVTHTKFDGPLFLCFF